MKCMAQAGPAKQLYEVEANHETEHEGLGGNDE